jgi:protein-disulfide isomerase
MSHSTTAARLTVPVTDHDHMQGPKTAPLTLVEYGDFQCPQCGRAYPIVRGLQEALGDDMRFVYRHFPLATIHPRAEPAAEAAEAAAAQRRFWEMHDTLFEDQEALEDEDFVEYAAELNLDARRFVDEMVRRLHATRVQEDFLGGARSGVNGTPTFFINDVRHEGAFDYATLLAALEDALEES